MSEELFERYLRNDLDEAGARQLSDLLATDEGARAFSEFVQEWTLLGEAAQQRLTEAGRQESRRLRKRPTSVRPGRAGIAWAAGIAAAVLFMIAIATPTRMPPPPQVTRVETPHPVPPEPPPAPPEVPPTPRPEPPPAVPRVDPPAPPPQPPPPAPRVEPPPPPAPVVPAPPKPVEPPRPERPRVTEADRTARPVIALLRGAAGEVFVLSAGGRRRAMPNEPIGPDEGLDVTGPHSQASLEFPDGIRIDATPETTLEKLSDRLGKKSFTLARGTVSAVVARQPAGRSFSVSTAHAELLVLGTQFQVAVTAESTRLDVREGRVRMTRDGASVDVAAGHSSIAMKGVKLESKPTVFTLELQDRAGYVGTRDTSISGADPSRTFGSEEVLEADGDETDGKKIYALLRWDLSDVPPGAVIRSAVITLHVVNASQGTGYSIFEMKRPWSEADASWTQASAQQPWKVVGLKSANEPLGTVAPRVKGALSILLTPAAEAIIQNWLRKPDANHGFLIANDTVSDGFKFHSREAFPHDLRPKLTLTYTLSK